MNSYSVEVRNKGNDRLVYAKIVSADSVSKAKNEIMVMHGIHPSRSEYKVTATLLKHK